MKKERLKILEMVEAGKINVEEAAKLLEALKSNSEFEWAGPDYDDAEEKLNQFSKNVDSFAKDFSEKFSSAFKEVEPRLKSATKIALEKTVCIIDDISRSMHEAAKNMDTGGDCCCGKESACECSEPSKDEINIDEPREN